MKTLKQHIHERLVISKIKEQYKPTLEDFVKWFNTPASEGNNLIQNVSNEKIINALDNSSTCKTGLTGNTNCYNFYKTYQHYYLENYNEEEKDGWYTITFVIGKTECRYYLTCSFQKYIDYKSGVSNVNERLVISKSKNTVEPPTLEEFVRWYSSGDYNNLYGGKIYELDIIDALDYSYNNYDMHKEEFLELYYKSRNERIIDFKETKNGNRYNMHFWAGDLEVSIYCTGSFEEFIKNHLENARKLNKHLYERLAIYKSKNHFKDYIQERLIISKTKPVLDPPKTKEELVEIIKNEIADNGKKCSLNHIDVSNITDFSYLFASSKSNNTYGLNLFNGDISDWDMSNATDLSGMFFGSSFNGDLSKWNVSKVENMFHIFAHSKYTGKNGDISDWDVSNVTKLALAFWQSKYEGDISNWDVSKVDSLRSVFDGNKVFNCDLSKWDVSNVKSVEEAFARTNYTQNLDSWNLKNCKNFDKCFEKSLLENNPPKWYKK